MAEAPAIHDLRLMTSPEVKAALPEIGCLLVPVGSCEQHGPNLSLAADAAQAAAYARLLAGAMHPRLARHMGPPCYIRQKLAYPVCTEGSHFCGVPVENDRPVTFTVDPEFDGQARVFEAPGRRFAGIALHIAKEQLPLGR